MAYGLIAYPVAVEEAVAHSGELLSQAARFALAVGFFLFIGGMAIAAPPVVSLSIAFVGTVLIAVFERRADPIVVDASG